MRALAKDLTVKSGKVELAGWVNSVATMVV